MIKSTRPWLRTVSRLIAWVSGLLLILFSLPVLFISAIGGILFLALGLFALPPIRRIIDLKYGRSFSQIAVVGILIFGFLFGMMVTAVTIPESDDSVSRSGSNLDAPSESERVQQERQPIEAGTEPERSTAAPEPSEPTSVPEPTPPPTLTPDPTVHQIGERFVVGDVEKDPVEYRVISTEYRESVGEGYFTEDADGVFLVVTIEMTNVGQDTTLITDDIFTIVDSRDREYSTDSDAIFYVAEDTVVVAEQLDPDVTKRAILVFDVPQDQNRPQLKIDPAGFWSIEDSHYVILD